MIYLFQLNEKKKQKKKCLELTEMIQGMIFDILLDA